jgi:ketosteroid isomerase-like protein
MAADAAFAGATARRGLDGWMDAYAPDAVRLAMGGHVSRGLAEIRAADSSLFADPAVRLTWMPTDGGAFGDGRHGFTTGRAAMVRAPADTVWTGTYVTFWRRDGGRWRVLLDTGASD